jgi:hypothetical protein
VAYFKVLARSLSTGTNGDRLVPKDSKQESEVESRGFCKESITFRITGLRTMSIVRNSKQLD